MGTRREHAVTVLLAGAAVVLTVTFFGWLVTQALTGDHADQGRFSVLFAVIAISNELVRTPLILTLALAASMARKPVPLVPAKGTNLLLITTFVPASEDVQRLRKMLIAAKKITGDGITSIVVADEGYPGSDKESPVPFLVEALNGLYGGNRVYYFSRKGIAGYNTAAGRYRARTKYGNINAALTYVRENPQIFGTPDFVGGFDPDHIPLPEVRERMLGYFGDPNVGYVVGPQAYENAKTNVVAALAESNQLPFHAVVQPAANLFGGAMFVGTSWIARWKVIRRIGGIQSSVTEDLETGVHVLGFKNPKTGRHWKAVYTPDVIAHGEGPDTFRALHVQQERWAKGAIGFIFSFRLIRDLLKMWRRPRVVAHYLLILMFYPIMGLSWLLAALNIFQQAVLGADGRIVDPVAWLNFYGWVLLLSVALYIRMRRYNTSPFEEGGKWGVAGLLLGVMLTPVYCHALVMHFVPERVKGWLRVSKVSKSPRTRPGEFAVTPKGTRSKGDNWSVFRLNIAWAAFYAAMILAGYASGNLNPINLFWAVAALLVSLAPVGIWQYGLFTRYVRRLRKGDGVRTTAPEIPAANEKGVR